MEQGKLSGNALREIVLDQLTVTRPEVVMGAQIGEDCCAVRTSGIVVLTTDPITAVDEKTGLLAIQVNANDIAAAGAEPLAALVTVLCPPSASEEDLRSLLRDINETASELHVDVIGGHTEVTDAVNRPVVSVAMLGVPVVPGHILSTGGMTADDTLVMTKYAGIEGTMILADRYARQLQDHLDEADLRQLNLLRGFMSVVPEGMIAARDPHVSAMHDITEGGVIGAAQEMCAASGVGLTIDRSKIPVLPVTRKICSILGVDVERLVSSGSMLIAVSDQSRLMEELAEHGIPATVIGHADAEDGLRDRATGEVLAFQAADEMYSANDEGGATT